MDLENFIVATQKMQGKYLLEFEDYINSSIILKKAAKQTNNDAAFIKQVMECFHEGKYCDIPVPDDKNLKKLWEILLMNKAYIFKLGAVVLPESGTPDERLHTILKYLESHLKQPGASEG